MINYKEYKKLQNIFNDIFNNKKLYDYLKRKSTYDEFSAFKNIYNWININQVENINLNEVNNSDWTEWFKKITYEMEDLHSSMKPILDSIKIGEVMPQILNSYNDLQRLEGANQHYDSVNSMGEAFAEMQNLNQNIKELQNSIKEETSKLKKYESFFFDEKEKVTNLRENLIKNINEVQNKELINTKELYTKKLESIYNECCKTKEDTIKQIDEF